MKNNIIYIITHKKIKEKYLENYIPLQVGKTFTNEDLHYLSDDTKKNIAYKNQNYCELTGIYWISQNCKLPEHIGVVHYRRFFMNNNFIGRKILTSKKIEKIFKKYEIILPKKFYFKNTVWKHYFEGGAGKEKDLIKLKELFESEYIDYIESFNKIFNQYGISYCNMFVMRKEDFYQYCNWIFEILEKLEKRIDLTNYNKSEARIYGYLSEILLNIWIDKHKLKVRYQRIKKVDNNFFQNIIWNLKMLKRKLIIVMKEKK